MAGYVRTNEKCPVCRQSFMEELQGRSVVLVCPEHRTSPRRYYVDTSGFGLKKRKRYSDKAGNPFCSREYAQQFLDSMRMAKKEKATWDPKEWDAVDCREFQFAVAWDRWEDSASTSWGLAYRRQVRHNYEKHLLPAWKNLDVRDIRNGHLEDLGAGLVRKGYAASTVNLALAIATSFLNALRRRGEIKALFTTPWEDDSERRGGTASRDQQIRIIRGTPLQYHPIFRWLALTGIRECEACAILVMDVADGHITICRSMNDYGVRTDRTKGMKRRGRGRGRAFKVQRKVIPEEMVAEIDSLTKDRLPVDNVYLFTNRSGNPFRPGVLSRVWKRSAVAAGLPWISLRLGTRHTFATISHREEHALADRRLSDRMGHSSPSITIDRYVREEG